MTLQQEAGLAEIVRRYNSPESYQQLLELAKPHIEANPLFAAIPYDPKSPVHDLSVVTLDPSPSSIDEIAGLLDIAYSPWRKVIVDELAKRDDLLDHFALRIAAGDEFSILLAHERIEDVAFVAAAFVHLMAGRIPYELLIQRIHIVISSIIRTVGVFDSPAAEILRKIGTVHFSFPRTESMRKGGFDETLITSSNKLVRLQIDRTPHKVLAVAGPGSVDKVVGLSASWIKRVIPDDYAEEHTTNHIQPVARGTAKLLEGLTVPVAAVLSGEEQFCEFGSLQMVGDHEGAHSMMRWIAKRRTRRTGVPTFYHSEPSKLSKLTKKRS